MKNSFSDIENLAHQVYDLVKITRDSCGYNEYFPQETILTEALELQEKLLEKGQSEIFNNRYIIIKIIKEISNDENNNPQKVKGKDIAIIYNTYIYYSWTFL